MVRPFVRDERNSAGSNRGRIDCIFDSGVSSWQLCSFRGGKKKKTSTRQKLKEVYRSVKTCHAHGRTLYVYVYVRSKESRQIRGEMKYKKDLFETYMCVSVIPICIVFSLITRVKFLLFFFFLLSTSYKPNYDYLISTILYNTGILCCVRPALIEKR